MSLSDNVRRLRHARFLTQVELAAKARVTPVTVARIESGNYVPYTRTIRQLAEALEVEPSELISAEELEAARRRPGKGKVAA